MGHRAGKKEESRARILASAGRGFRKFGFGGLGVDGIAKDAGVTSGAFYAHFPSKAAAFHEAVAAGMIDLRNGIARFQQESGTDWVTDFVDFYLGERRTCDPGDSCALQALSNEVARSDEQTRNIYENEFRQIVTLFADGLDGNSSVQKKKSIALLALLAGGVSLSRAVHDPALSGEIADAVRDIAGKLVKKTEA